MVNKHGAIIIDASSNTILVIKEKSYPRDLVKLGLPKGKIEQGETREQCIDREIWEEVGINLNRAKKRYPLNKDVDIVIFAEQPLVIPGPEIDNYRWIPIHKLKVRGKKYNLFYRRNIQYWQNKLGRQI